MWNAFRNKIGGHGSHRDGADMDVAEIDQPAFFASLVVAAAGEGGHNPLKRELSEQAIVLKRRRG